MCSSLLTCLCVYVLRVGFPENQILRKTLVSRKFIREHSRVELLLNEREGSTIRQREKMGFNTVSTKASADYATLILESFRVVLSWGERLRPLYSCIDHSLDMRCLEKGSWSWARQLSLAEAILQRANSWELLVNNISSIFGNKSFSLEKRLDSIEYSWQIHARAYFCL